jgi:hypothetical protein
MDYGVALGRRFRALKLWFVLRWFGADGLRAALRRHIEIARTFAGWVDQASDFERLAPAHFSVVTFRYRPPGEDRETVLEALNASILQRINASGEVFLSHTKVDGRYALRLAVGNVRTTEAHVARVVGPGQRGCRGCLAPARQQVAAQLAGFTHDFHRFVVPGEVALERAPRRGSPAPRCGRFRCLQRLDVRRNLQPQQRLVPRQVRLASPPR